MFLETEKKVIYMLEIKHTKYFLFTWTLLEMKVPVYMKKVI